MFLWMKGGMESCRVLSVISIREVRLEIGMQHWNYLDNMS